MRELSFAVTHDLNASNEAVWAVIGEFGTEHRWTRALSECARDTADVRVGTTRRCRLPRPLMGRSEVRETLVEFDRGRALAYVLDGAAGPFATAESRWVTDAISERSTAVTVAGSFRPRNWIVRLAIWPLLKPMLSRLTRGVLVELEAYLEGLERSAPSSASA